MKKITVGSSGRILDALHLVLDVGEKGALLDFGSIIEDIIITSPQGDVYMSWTILPNEEFNEEECLLLQVKDNMKEFADVNCTQLALKPVEQKTIRVFVTLQNN